MHTDALNPDLITPGLKTARIGSQVIVFSSTASTNDIAWHYAAKKANDGLAVFAEEQSAGRGRTGNKWLSTASQSILCSIVLMDEKLEPEMLTLTSAVAVAAAIGTCGKNQAKIKWPNDILLNSKKVSGILLESKISRGKKNYVLGIGINCHQSPESFDEQIRPIATSIDIETGANIDRISLCKRLLVSLDEWLITAANEKQAVIDKWLELNTQLHSRVSLRHNNRTFTGVVIGIDPQKGLIVQIEGGGVRIFDAGHTSNVR
ncbi:MAG: biotin--[acetyl-CoA-carboxylase] ligase [Planctomycetes bacterium GWF2_50_10]|nr:MAG: biotin--[acetyl-CoA-carboxylase] ligase [Planctomycetes bacterium GWF2_50_10]